MATKLTFLTIFCLGVELVRDEECFFGKSYYVILPSNQEGSKQLG